MVIKTDSFAKRLRGDRFTESLGNSIEFPVDDPQDMVAVLCFFFFCFVLSFYTGNILDSNENGFRSIHANWHTDKTLSDRIRAFIVADKYCVGAMCDKVCLLVQDCPASWLP